MPPFTVLKSPATTLCFTEPLENLGDAIPLDMVLVKGGSFLMGSPKDEPNREPSEGPQHLVTVPEFFMGRHPVTQAQYESLMGDNPATAYEADRFVAPNK
ncbi:MAG: SUMF1/EgtB/PvdO family nonheme iron enzyme, partial [Cyanobacteria bacterium J06639_14]